MRSLALLLVAVTLAAAYPTYQAQIPNGDKVWLAGAAWPGVGHLARGGGGDRNPFGMDFAANNHIWKKCLCQMDSDGDGRTNGEELGDPNCVWTPGTTPERTTSITHPGFNDATYVNPVTLPDRCNTTLANEEIKNGTVSTLRFYMNPNTITTSTTSYMCQGFNFSQTSTEDAIRFRPHIIQPDIVHHIVVYQCTKPVQPTVFECGTMPDGCVSMLYIWAVGGQELCVPDEVGFRVGLDGVRYVAMQMHYNNPNHVPGLVDTSGVEIDVTTHQRQFAAGIVGLGFATDDIHIPPQMTNYSITNECGPAFTQYIPYVTPGIVPARLRIFGQAPHMHKHGRAMFTNVYRNRTGEWFPLLDKPDYDYNAQTVYPLDPNQVWMEYLDTFQITCFYNSMDSNETVNGCEETSCEMCFNFLYYYPFVNSFPFCLRVDQPFVANPNVHKVVTWTPPPPPALGEFCLDPAPATSTTTTPDLTGTTSGDASSSSSSSSSSGAAPAPTSAGQATVGAGVVGGDGANNGGAGNGFSGALGKTLGKDFIFIGVVVAIGLLTALLTAAVCFAARRARNQPAATTGATAAPSTTRGKDLEMDSAGRF